MMGVGIGRGGTGIDGVGIRNGSRRCGCTGVDDTDVGMWVSDGGCVAHPAAPGCMYCDSPFLARGQYFFTEFCALKSKKCEQVAQKCVLVGRCAGYALGATDNDREMERDGSHIFPLREEERAFVYATKSRP